jgi:hypothetical protein
MPSKRPPKDANQLAKYILEVSMGEAERIEPPKRNPIAVESGKRGGIKGGSSRAAKLSPRKRSEIAQKAAKTRWAKKG